MSDSGKRLKREEDIKARFREIKDRSVRIKDPRDKGTRTKPPFGGRPDPRTLKGIGDFGLSKSAVEDLLDNLKVETDKSKAGVANLDKIMGPMAGAGLKRVVKGTTNLLKKKERSRGGMNEDDVVDLTTEMVIDE